MAAVRRRANISSVAFLSIASLMTTRSQNWGGITGRETACKGAQKYFLVSLYSATDGRNWRYHWDTDYKSDPCFDNWYGVTCDNEGNVIKLILPQNRMTGALPDRWEKLEKLQAVDLSFNQLVQTLPTSLAKISTLKHINVQSNYFNGAVPSELGDMPNLVFLDLSLNRFEGDVPSSILTRRDQRRDFRFYERSYGGENSGVRTFDTKYGKHTMGSTKDGYLTPAVSSNSWGA